MLTGTHRILISARKTVFFKTANRGIKTQPVLKPVKIPSLDKRFDYEIPKSFIKPVVNKEPVVAKLANGMQTAVKDTNDIICSIALSVKAGSRFENEDFFGRSSFLEKLAFRSSEDNTSFSIAQQLERMGAEVKSQSTREMNIYSVNILRKFAPTAIEILADIVGSAALNMHEINNAKFEYTEMIKSLDTDTVLEENAHAAAYGRKGLGVPLVASRAMLDKMTREELQLFNRRLINPEHMALSAVGVSPSVFAKASENFFGGLKKPEDATPEGSSGEYKGGEIRRFEEDQYKPSTFSLAFHLKDGWQSRSIPAICVLGSLLGGGNEFSVGGPGKGMHSRLYRRILAGSAAARSIAVLAQIHSDNGIFGISGTSDYTHTPELVWLIVREAREMTEHKLLTQEALHRAKNAALSAFLINLESRATVTEDYCRQLAVYGKVMSVDELRAMIEAVTRQDVLKVAKELLQTNPSVVLKGNTRDSMTYEQIKAALKK